MSFLADALAPFLDKFIKLAVPVLILLGIIGILAGHLARGAENAITRFIHGMFKNFTKRDERSDSHTDKRRRRRERND